MATATMISLLLTGLMVMVELSEFSPENVAPDQLVLICQPEIWIAESLPHSEELPESFTLDVTFQDLDPDDWNTIINHSELWELLIGGSTSTDQTIYAEADHAFSDDVDLRASISVNRKTGRYVYKGTYYNRSNDSYLNSFPSLNSEGTCVIADPQD